MSTLDDFINSRDLAPMRRAKLRMALEKPTRVNGSAETWSRAALIERLVRDGAKIELKPYGRILISPNGNFFDEPNITRTAIDYAAYLIEVTK